jgi:predicted phage baseplate assembly protein
MAIDVPAFEFSGFYYPEILEALIQFLRTDVEEITDESPEEPFIQLLRAFALTGHLSNVLIDIVANERFLPTARLRPSVRALLQLIDYRLAQARPAAAEVVVELSQVFNASTTVVPAASRFATEETEQAQAVVFEALSSVATERTDRIGAVVAYRDATTTWADHTANAIAAIPFDVWGAAPAAGDALYVGHATAIWDALRADVDIASPGVTGVWEFYAGDFEGGQPDGVTNLGSTLRLTLNGILGSASRAGTIVRVRCVATGATEDLAVTFSGGVNRVDTATFLGQSVPSTDASAYVVGSDWREVGGLTDETVALSVAGVGDVSYRLPQTLTETWRKTVVNGVEAYWIRFRVIAAVGANAVELAEIRVDAGGQFLVVEVRQGESQEDAPLGSSTGLESQTFQLLQFPVLDDESLRVFVDEGLEQEWTRVNDFLSSTPVDRHFRVEFDDDGRCTVTFGDGVNGKIPAAGVNNIRALYRTMEEVNGNVGAGAINVNQSGIAFANRVYNPRQASGFRVREGSTPEDLARVKLAGPATLRTRDRVVSSEDAEILATAQSSNLSIVRALAVEEAFGPKTVGLVCVGAGGAGLTAAQLDAAEKFFNGDPVAGTRSRLVLNHQLTAENYTPKIVNVVATVYGGNLAAVKTALTALLSPVAVEDDGVTWVWDFGGEVPVSRINAAIFATTPRPRKVVITTPASDVVLGDEELPNVGTLTITVAP